MLHRRRNRPAPASDAFAASMPAVVPATGAPPAKRPAGGPAAEADDFSLTVPVMVDVGTDIQAMVRPDLLNEALAKVRRALYFDLGVPFPGISCA